MSAPLSSTSPGIESAATLFALRRKLFDFSERMEMQKAAEEETLRRLFKEAGGSLSMLDPLIPLSERAMAGLIVGSEGDRNLQAFRKFIVHTK